MKSRGGKSQRSEEKRRREKVRAEKGPEERRCRCKNSVFPMICGSRGSKGRLAKAAGADPSAQMRYINV